MERDTDIIINKNENKTVYSTKIWKIIILLLLLLSLNVRSISVQGLIVCVCVCVFILKI